MSTLMCLQLKIQYTLSKVGVYLMRLLQRAWIIVLALAPHLNTIGPVPSPSIGNILCKHTIQVKASLNIFTESAPRPRPTQSISRNVRGFAMFPLGFTFCLRGMETYSRRGSSLNCLNMIWSFFAKKNLGVFLLQSQNLLQPHHKSSWDFHSS